MNKEYKTKLKIEIKKKYGGKYKKYELETIKNEIMNFEKII